MSKKSKLAKLKARRKKLDQKKSINKPIAIAPDGTNHVMVPGVPIAQYQCQQCELEFIGAPSPCICPKCHHIYVMWTNYDEFKV